MGPDSERGVASATIYPFPVRYRRVDATGVYFALRIDNYAHLSAAYGQAAAQRVQDAILVTLGELVGDAGDVTTEREGSVQARILDRQELGLGPLESASARFLQALLVEVAERPIQVGEDVIHVAVSGAWSAPDPLDGRPSALRGGGASAALTSIPRHVEPASAGAGWAARYRKDMAAAAAVFAALAGDQLALALQPVASAADRSVVLYSEGLPSLRGDGGRLASAGGFLPSLERLGLVRLLDREMVVRALDHLAADTTATLGVNISAQSAHLDGWWRQTVEILSRRRDLAERLVIGVTETWPLPSIAEAATFSARMRDLGCRIAVNNFGSGHASIRQLLALRPDIVKVDPFFLGRAEYCARDEAALGHIVGLAAAMAPVVVLGGVETAALGRIARSAGAVWHQGSFLGAAEPGVDASRLAGAAQHQAGAPRPART